MAARRTPQAKAGGAKPNTKPAPRPKAKSGLRISGDRAATKAAQAKLAGYDSAAAQSSVTRQYGMVKNEVGAWVKPDFAFLVRQMESLGYGPQAQAGSLNEQGTPVNIGGARWFSGKSGVTFSGERSDAAKRNPGAAFGAAKQTSYGKGKGKGKGPGKNPGGKPTGNPVLTGGPAPTPEAAVKAGAATFASGVSGKTQEFIKEAGQSKFAAGEAEDTGPTKDKGKKRPAKKLVKKAKKKSSPGGTKITPRERKKIRAVKRPQAVKKASDRMRQRNKKK